MSEMWKQVILEGIQGIIGVVITVLLAFVRKKYSEYVNTDTKQKLVNDTVYYVEQVFSTLHGKEKLEKAKSTLVTLLAQKGIGFTEEELNVLIESAVNQLNLQQNSTLTSVLATANDNNVMALEPLENVAQTVLYNNTVEDTDEVEDVEEVEDTDEQ